jgi:hypothetical protein
MMSIAQPKEPPLFFNEVSVCGNLFSHNRGAYFRPGFGVGIHRVLRHNHPFNVRVGLEYQLTRQYYSRLIGSKFSSYTDVNMTVNSIVLPVFFRYAIGKTNQIIPAIGFFNIFSLPSNFSGTRWYNGPAGSYHNDVTSSIGFGGLNPGIAPSVGYGFLMRQKYNALITLDYRFGLTRADFSPYEYFFFRYLVLSFNFRFLHKNGAK